MGIFYIESPATRQLLHKMRMADFDHLIVATSIIRPAANDHIREYVRRQLQTRRSQAHLSAGVHGLGYQQWGRLLFLSDLPRRSASHGLSPVGAGREQEPVSLCAGAERHQARVGPHQEAAPGFHCQGPGGKGSRRAIQWPSGFCRSLFPESIRYAHTNPFRCHGRPGTGYDPAVDILALLSGRNPAEAPSRPSGSCPLTPFTKGPWTRFGLSASSSPIILSMYSGPTFYDFSRKEKAEPTVSSS